MVALAVSAIVMVVASTTPPGNQPRVSCGMFDYMYETTIGVVRGHPRSIIAVSAITTEAGYRHALGWMVFDERGDRWLATAPNSPPDLRAFETEYSAPRTPVAFTYFDQRLPPRYRLTPCALISE